MYSIYIIGAGFSKPAGFPLGSELLKEILIKAKQTNRYNNILKRDIDEYIRYQYKVNNLRIDEDSINLEDFISYLDIEHFLGLKGGDTWSEEGNRCQILIRNLIAQLLNERLNKIDKDTMDLYLKFSEKLDPTDYIITFNYDTLLETCLEKLGKPYRLFPLRFKEISTYYNTIKKDECEIVILKMHGSIDWFDISPFDRLYNYSKDEEQYFKPKHLIFNNPVLYHPEKIISGSYNRKSPLNNIYRVKNLENYFASTSMVIESPMIISPSYSKMVYINPLREFWFGLDSAGSFNKKVSIIGFSLPEHDDYVRQPIYNLINNFQNYKINIELFKKKKLTVIDYQKTKTDIKKFKRNYRFINWRKTTVCFNGFSESSIDLSFE
jgi:hypothetical protein